MKKFQMVWIGTDLPLVTSGRTYVITGKVKEDGFYSYLFVNNNGEEDSAASFLFARPKRKVYGFNKNPSN